MHLYRELPGRRFDVELLIGGRDVSPRRLHRGRRGVLVCAEPHRYLSDDEDGGEPSRDRAGIADDAVLALLLAAPLTDRSLWALEAHVRGEPYRARVVLPVYLAEQDESARTGVSLRLEPMDGDVVLPVGVIFDCGERSTIGPQRARSRRRFGRRSLASTAT